QKAGCWLGALNMSKTLAATCSAGVVTSDTIVTEAEILSKGVGDSEGILIQDEDRAYYLANTIADLEALLEKLISTLEQVKSGLDKTVDALTALDTAAFLVAADAGVPSPPVAASDIASIGSASTNI